MILKHAEQYIKLYQVPEILLVNCLLFLPCSEKVSILTGLDGFIIIWMIIAISFIFYLSSLYTFFFLCFFFIFIL